MVMSDASTHHSASLFGRIWPFRRSASYDDDMLVDTSTIVSTSIADAQQSLPILPKLRRRAVYLQRLDADLKGTGELVPHARASSLDLIWDLNEVHYPLTELAKTPRSKDIHALRAGIRQEIFKDALVRKPYGAYDPVDAAILLTDRLSGEHFSYHPDYVEEVPCKLTRDERRDRQLLLVFMKGEELPTYYFWQAPEDPDPSEQFYLDENQLIMTERLVRQSTNRFQRLQRYLATDETNESKALFAEETFAAIAELLAHMKFPMSWDLIGQTNVGIDAMNLRSFRKLVNQQIGYEFFDVCHKNGKDKHGGSDTSYLPETSSSPHETHGRHEQHETDDSISRYPGEEPQDEEGDGDGEEIIVDSSTVKPAPVKKVTSTPVSRTTKRKGRPRKSKSIDRTYNGANNLPLSPGEVSPLLRRLPKRKSPDHPDASYQPQKLQKARLSSQAKAGPEAALRRGVTRSGARFRLAKM